MFLSAIAMTRRGRRACIKGFSVFKAVRPRQHYAAAALRTVLL